MIDNQPRGDMSGWDEYEPETAVDAPNGVKLSRSYITDGNFFGRFDPNPKPIEYSWNEPLHNMYSSNRASDYPVTQNNYGYGAVYESPQLRNEINRVAEEHKIPGRWLSDAIAMTTGGTFSPFYEQGGGSFGYAAKTLRQIKDMGVSPLLYGQGDLNTQLDVVSSLLDKSGGVAQQGAEYTLTSIINPELAQRVYDKPREARALNNGVYTLEDMWNRLGSHADIAYNHALNTRRQIENSHVHDGFNQNCAWCRALAASKSPIVPHEFQDAYSF